MLSTDQQLASYDASGTRSAGFFAFLAHPNRPVAGGGFAGGGGYQSRWIDPAYLPRMVNYPTSQAPGTIVIDTRARYLYLILGKGMAKRYGVGVGRPGFQWAGAHTIVVDRPEGRAGGNGLGFNGAQLLGLTIGGCFCNDLRYVAHANGIALGKIGVSVTVELDGDPLLATFAIMSVSCETLDGTNAQDLIDDLSQAFDRASAQHP